MKVCKSVLARAAGKVGVVVLAGAVLASCGMSQVTAPFRSKEKRQTWEPVVSEERLLEAARSDNGGGVSIETAFTGCPKFLVWPRDRLLTVYDVGRVGDGLAIQYRGEITKTARECQIQPNHVSMKYGFAGRVLLGPRGRPGNVRMPVRIHLTDLNRNIISTQNMTVDVTIPNDNPVGYFSAVNTISFNVAPGVAVGDYQLFIAFDRKDPGTG